MTFACLIFPKQFDRRNHDIFQLTLRKARLSAAGRRNLVVDFYVTGERSTDARY